MFLLVLCGNKHSDKVSFSLLVSLIKQTYIFFKAYSQNRVVTIYIYIKFCTVFYCFSFEYLGQGLTFLLLNWCLQNLCIIAGTVI